MKNSNTYMDVNGKESFHFDYTSDATLYKNHAKLLERFVSTICYFIHKSAIDDGQINANTTSEVL